MILSPIALFTYNRPDHTRQTVEALLKNDLSGASELYVFSDGSRTAADNEKIRELREYIKSIVGFKKITLFQRESNLGLAPSIISGVTRIIEKHDRIIVLEDDMVTSPWFLRYMNEALDFYRDEEQVISVHGYLYPVREELPETFFLKGADCWGWGTWKRGWNLFEQDGEKLLRELRERNLTRDFDFDCTYWYTRSLEEQISGRIDSWAIRWYASAFLKDKLTLYPGRSLLRNIGTDDSGTNCHATDQFETTFSPEPVRISRIPLEENQKGREAFKGFFRTLYPSLGKRVVNKIIRILCGNR